MGARGEALAKQFEAKAAEFTAAIEKLSDADWKKVTTAEKWSVGVTAHHVAGAHEPISNIVKTLSAGQSIPGFTMPMLDEMNAKHAKDFANVTKAETLDIHKKGVATAAAVVRGIADADFDKSGSGAHRHAAAVRPAGRRGHPRQPHQRAPGQHPRHGRELSRHDHDRPGGVHRARHHGHAHGHEPRPGGRRAVGARCEPGCPGRGGPTVRRARGRLAEPGRGRVRRGLHLPAQRRHRPTRVPGGGRARGGGRGQGS